MNAVETGATIDYLLRESGLPRAESGLLLRILLGCERVHVIAHGEDTVDPSAAKTARNWFARRRAGEPVSYITGLREFYGIDLCVTPDVLIPRPETERLVELVLDRFPAGLHARALELGTGSGAIAIALAMERPTFEITASDISEVALAIARRNARGHGVDIEFVLSDWFASIGPGSFDLIVSNPPYIAAGDAHLEQGDLRFEPRLALFGGKDGLDCIRGIATQAREKLCAGGRLLLEHGYDQGDRCVKLLHALGYAEIEDHSDIAGWPRACECTWPG